MKRGSFHAACLGLFVAAMVAGCASSPGGAKPEHYSGYLGDYSKLREDKTAAGEPIFRYVNPKFTATRYQAVLLEPVTFYPQPRPSEEVSQQQLEAIRDYMNQALRREFGKRFTLVPQPGQGVARINVALTAVGSETEDLKPYQYLPIALVATGAKAAATGGRPEDAVIQVEAKVSDSMTDERLYSGLRRGSGERVTKQGNAGRQVTVDQLKKLMDQWAQRSAAEAARFIAPR